jgi:predicted nucleic acid binding AN1-type Zn finger protein
VTVRRLLALGLVVGATGVGCVAEVGDPSDEEVGTTELALTPEMSRDEIVAIAQSAVGYSYYWGGDQWDPSSKKNPGKCIPNCSSCGCPSCSHSGQWGADCSGLVGKAWQVPGKIPITQHLHPYNTMSFLYQRTHWYGIKRSQLQRGDALTSTSHIVLFDRMLSNGQMMVYECAGCSIGCKHRGRSVSSNYVAIRRRNVNDEPPNRPPKGWLNHAACDTISGWAQDPNTPKKAVDVVLTFGGPITKKGVAKKTLSADKYKKSLCNWLGSCNHWFEIATPGTLKDGKKHTVYAYAIDSSKKGRKLLALAPKTVKCQATTQGSCSHSPCDAGGPLTTSCNTCTNAVCLAKPECCNKAWDASCVAAMVDTTGACAGFCAAPSSCAHSECAPGATLPTTCSPCAQSVCGHDAYCCKSGWDQICANEGKDDPYCGCG